MKRQESMLFLTLISLTTLVVVFMVISGHGEPLSAQSVIPTYTWTPTPITAPYTPTFTPIPPTPTATFTPLPPTPTPANAFPSVTVDMPLVTVDEGQMATNGGTANDPDGIVAALWASTGEATDHHDGTWSWSYTPADGPADSQQVMVSAVDNTGAQSAVTFDLVVNNVAPDLGPISGPQVPVGISDQPIMFTAVFTDPGPVDTHTAYFDWGDGSACVTSSTNPDCTVTTTGGPGSVEGSHTYSAPGVYAVELTLLDKDAGSASALFEYTVVYDPDGGFVSGGGWIDSPAGAYVPDPLLAGKPTFGFVSKYKKGATVPTGNTHFQFMKAGLNFHSASYDWLVINQDGSTVQFKGSGTINGQLAPNGQAYKVMIWASDGSPDTFRIKIWYETTGGEDVVYDNGSEQSTGGGSIKVHTAK